jgi:hypothetical protein
MGSMQSESSERVVPQASAALKCRRKFLRYFPGGFRDKNYLAWERDYKVEAHRSWTLHLNRDQFATLLRANEYEEAAMRAVKTESRTNLIFSFEKMALRDAVRSKSGARTFANGLYDFIYGERRDDERFNRWCAVVGSLPHPKTRVLTWPVVTVFAFIALPHIHYFYKPTVTRAAAHAYGYHLTYASRPSWETYQHALEFARVVQQDLRDLRPRDMIDIQSFLWVLGSAEYRD